MSTITSANSIFTLIIPGLYPTPVRIEGYGPDEAINVDPIATTEAVIGVDGHKSAGYVFSLVKQKITLQPDSKSLPIFIEWVRAMRAQREDITCSASLEIPAIGESYNMVNGSLTSYPPIPNVKKVLQPMQFEITWESVEPAEV